MLNKERIWKEMIRCDTAVQKMVDYESKTFAKNRRKKQIEGLKYLLVSYADALYKNGEISKTVTSYEEYKESQEIYNWLKENAPADYDIDKDDYFNSENSPAQKEVIAREFAAKGHIIEPEFLKRFLRSSGFLTFEEVDDKAIKAIAKKYNVELGVAKLKIKLYYREEALEETKQKAKTSEKPREK